MPKRGTNIGYMDTNYLRLDGTNAMEAGTYFNTAGDGFLIDSDRDFYFGRYASSETGIFFNLVGSTLEFHLLSLPVFTYAVNGTNVIFGNAGVTNADIVFDFVTNSDSGSFRWSRGNDKFSFDDKVLLDFSVTGIATHNYHEVETGITGVVATNVTAYRATLRDDSSSNVGHIKIGFDVDNVMKHNQTAGDWEDYGAYLDMGSLAEIPNGSAFPVNYELYGSYIKRDSICVGNALSGSWNDISAYGIYLEGWAGAIDDDAGIAGTFTRYAIYSNDGDVYLNSCNLTVTGTTIDFNGASIFDSVLTCEADGLSISTLRDFWAFNYGPTSGAASTGVFFNTATSSIEFYLTTGLTHSFNVSTGDITATGDIIAGDDLQAKGDVLTLGDGTTVSISQNTGRIQFNNHTMHSGQSHAYFYSTDFGIHSDTNAMFLQFGADTISDKVTFDSGLNITFGRNLVIGAGRAATDYTLTFNGAINDGVITWMEALDYFLFADSILMATTEPVYFRDTAIYAWSSADGWLNLVADVGVEINAPVWNLGDLYVAGDISLDDNSAIIFGTGGDMSIYYDAVDGNIDTSLIAPSDLLITCGANKTIELQNVVYNDIYIGLSGAKIPVANTPTWATFTTNTKAYTFALNDYIDINASEMKHDWKEGTDIEIHVHWASNGTDVNDRTVKWEIFYTWGDIDEAFSAEANANAETIIPNATNVDKTHYYTSVVTVAGSGFKIGSLGTLRLRRIASTGTEPTNNPFGLMVGVHYQVDTMGSRQQLVK